MKGIRKGNWRKKAVSMSNLKSYTYEPRSMNLRYAIPFLCAKYQQEVSKLSYMFIINKDIIGTYKLYCKNVGIGHEKQFDLVNYSECIWFCGNVESSHPLLCQAMI